MCKYFSASKALKAKSGILFHNAPEQIINMYSDLTKLSGQPEANTILPEEEVALEILGEDMPRECVGYKRCLISKTL